MDDIAFSTLSELAAGLESGAYSCVELTRYFLDRIGKLDAKAHAFVAVYEESALLQAQAADIQRRSALPHSPVHGLPIALKDICEIVGHVTTAGSAAWAKRVTNITCTIVERLLASGVILLGKNHMAEFCFGAWGTNPLMGTPRNPWDWDGPHRIPGGSSSGSAVAVAAGLAPAAIGSDTGGSVRMPASLNALTGLKPSYGRISLYGTLPFVPALDSIGVLTRSAQDAAFLIDVIAGPDYRDPATRDAPFCMLSAAAHRPNRPLRIAVMRPDEYSEPVTDDVQRATDDAVDVFRSLGNYIEHVNVPLDFDELVRNQGLISAAEAYRVHSVYIEDMALPFGPATRKRIIHGKSINATDYLAALAHRRQTMDRFHEWMQSYDLLLTPTLPFAAFPVDQVDEDSTSILSFVRPVSYLGGCAISLPSGFSEEGLPCGVQLIAGRWREDLLVEAGCAFQAVTDWHQRVPPGLQ